MLMGLTQFRCIPQYIASEHAVDEIFLSFYMLTYRKGCWRSVPSIAGLPAFMITGRVRSVLLYCFGWRLWRDVQRAACIRFTAPPDSLWQALAAYLLHHRNCLFCCLIAWYWGRLLSPEGDNFLLYPDLLSLS